MKLPNDLARLCGGQLTPAQALQVADRLLALSSRLYAYARRPTPSPRRRLLK